MKFCRNFGKIFRKWRTLSRIKQDSLKTLKNSRKLQRQGIPEIIQFFDWIIQFCPCLLLSLRGLRSCFQPRVEGETEMHENCMINSTLRRKKAETEVTGRRRARISAAGTSLGCSAGCKARFMSGSKRDCRNCQLAPISSSSCIRVGSNIFFTHLMKSDEIWKKRNIFGGYVRWTPILLTLHD